MTHMNIASRTPEGSSSRCPLCDKATEVEFSSGTDDATCPHCGCLLWKSAEMLSRLEDYLNGLGVTPVTAESRLETVTEDSLDVVEMVMALEDEFDFVIPDEDYDQLRTVADVIRYIQRRRADG